MVSLTNMDENLFYTWKNFIYGPGMETGAEKTEVLERCSGINDGGISRFSPRSAPIETLACPLNKRNLKVS